MHNLIKYILVLNVTIGASTFPVSRLSARQDSSEAFMRQQLISFLQNGGEIGGLTGAHPLYPLSQAPSIATVSWILLREEEELLKSLYPVINRAVMAGFAEERTTPQGLLLSRFYPCVHKGALSSPDINSLAALELHTLSLIAITAGEYEDALELGSWARKYRDLTLRAFYDPAGDCFFPIGSQGEFLSIYSPEMLLPMLLDDSIGEKSIRRISDRLMYKMSVHKRGSASFGSMWEDPALRAFVKALLANIKGISPDRLEGICEDPLLRTKWDSGQKARTEWTSIFDNRNCGPAGRLFPAYSAVSSLIILSRLAEREQLFDKAEISPLLNDIDTLTIAIAEETSSLDMHIYRTALVNRLLVRLERISNMLESKDKLWRILDENRWKRFSPRFRNLLLLAFRDSIDELMRAKRILSQQVASGEGLVADVRLPDSSVPLGRSVNVEVSIRSLSHRFEIERLYLQIAGTRWDLMRDGEKAAVFPPENVFRVKRGLSTPPSAEPGIVAVPYFFDFMISGKRIEIHGLESVTTAKGYDVTLNFPKGCKMTDGSAVPVNIVLKYPADNSIQGTVDGVLLQEMSCTPPLPARFVIKGGSKITTLPLEINTRPGLAPGIYPVSLSVQIDKRTIAVFEEKLVRPIRWLHLGPSLNQRWLFEDAASNPEELFNSPLRPEAGASGWLEVPAGALDLEGSVLPDRLYGSGGGKGMILYSYVAMNEDSKVNWSLKSANTVSLWINHAPVVSASREGSLLNGSTVLRKGRNAIMISAWFATKAEPVLLAFADESGLPVHGMNNDIDEIYSQYAMIRAADASSAEMEAARSGSLEVRFELDHPGASEVSLIGEFNNWDPDSTPMQLHANGRWQASVYLPRGRYQYKFLIDRKRKITDPAGSAVEPDGFGGLNSVIDVK